MQEDVEEGPFLQHMPGEQLRNQLQHMAKALTNAMSRLSADEPEKAANRETKVKIIDAYRKSEKRDRQRILTRKNVIENRKEKLEIISKQKVRVCRCIISNLMVLNVAGCIFLYSGCQTEPKSMVTITKRM